MTGYDIENYYLNTPPFEIADKGKYINFLQFQSQMTMMELSENNPVLTEGSITAIAPVSIEEYTSFDLNTLNPNFMNLMVIEESEKLIDILSDPYVMRGSLYYTGFGVISSGSVATAMRNNSVLSLLAINDYIPIIEEWFSAKKEYMIFDNSFIKLKVNTDYYVLYRRYKTVAELNSSELRTFKDLLGINLMLDIYQSDIFAAEGGIRSVSLSGLSVSFNVPEQMSKVASLTKQKSDLINRISMDYSDGCIGLI
jgi:hypothetical protein